MTFLPWRRLRVRAIRQLAVLLAAAACTPADVAAGQSGQTSMEDMITAIQDDARFTRSYTGRSAISAPVIEALRSVRRERFVPDGSQSAAYLNRPLGIGHGQTISQPFIVALMTDLMEPAPDHRVLEIGTGSGYQAAVLSRLVAEVYTVEIIPELGAAAAERLERLGYDNVHVEVGDGWFGWPDAAPFDAIIITAVSATVPPRLVEQLADDGRLVMPLGDPNGYQELVVVTKTAAGGTAVRDVLPVQFVPLTGDHD